MIEGGAPVNQAQEEGQRQGSGYRLHPTLPAQLSEGTERVVFLRRVVTERCRVLFVFSSPVLNA